MSKSIKIGLAAIAALLAAGVAALLLIDAERFRPTLKSQLEKALARPVALGSLAVSWYPLGLGVGSLQIGEDPRFGTRPFVVAKQVKVSAKILPLLSGRLEIQSVDIIEPQVELIRRNGVWNYESVGGPKNEPSSSPSSVQLGAIGIHDGQAAVTLDAGPRTVYPKTNLSLTGIGPGQGTFKMTASGTAADLTGNLTAAGEMKNGALRGTLSLRDAKLGKTVKLRAGRSYLARIFAIKAKRKG